MQRRLKLDINICNNILILTIVLLIFSNPVCAFYEQRNDHSEISARGLIRSFASYSAYPDDPLLYPDESASGAAGIARLIFDANISEHWHIEANAYQSYIPASLLTAQNTAGLLLPVERSAALETNLSDSNTAQLAVDRLSLNWSSESFSFTIGRQAINLATTFYFTANDFFAPFSAQTFYRVYKQGVDALRIELGIGALSQVSLLSVLGYSQDPSSDTGWSNHPNNKRRSDLLQWSNVYGSSEITLLAGKVTDRYILAGALQGEFFDWLGVRFEGHVAEAVENNFDSFQKASLGLEHRWDNNSDLRLELFYNGQGADSVSKYQATQITQDNPYLASRYSAIGGQYQLTPLLTSEIALISNLIDYSHLISLNAIYSLSDESEAVFTITVPTGDHPENGQVQDEFGAYPVLLNLEYRLYF